MFLVIIKNKKHTYSNIDSFLKAVFDAGVERVAKNGDVRQGFVFPSYVEDVMGPVINLFWLIFFFFLSLYNMYKQLISWDSQVCFDYGYG